MRLCVLTMMVALSLCVGGCGGSTDYSGGSPATPTPTPVVTPTPPGGIVTVDVVSENGAQSFSPNPAALPAGQMVIWHNIDGVTHRVVLNNGSLDTGDLRPGASSQAMSINGGGGGYHCSIHPSMVGTIQPAASDSPAY
jgi:plastocyanin